MDMMENNRELISALADGQLQGEDFARGVQVAAGDAAALETWQNYHLIGDVLRSGDRAVGRTPAQFMTRLSASLAREPAFEPVSVAAAVQPIQTVRAPAANDASFRWKLVAGVASVAAVAAIGWSAVGGLGTRPEQAQLAVAAPAPATVVVGSGGGAMIRDARLDELLAAHRQLGGASALQMPSGFLRNATFEGPAR